MSMGATGMLLTIAGALLVAAGWFYFDLSLWALVPGGILMLVGTSLLNGAKEQILARVRHRVSDSYESKGDGDASP